jgi:hypothetical protein
MTIDKLKPLDEMIAKIKADAEDRKVETLKGIDAGVAESIQNLESTRLALALLLAEGVIDVKMGEWNPGESAWIDLGLCPKTKAGRITWGARFRAVKRALGAFSPHYDSYLADARRKLIEVVLTPLDFPTIRVKYQRRFIPGAKCRIVKHICR